MRKLVFALVALAFAATAEAQVSSLAIDISKAQFSWDYVLGKVGTPSEFNIKCGLASGKYTIIHKVVGSATRFVPVTDVISVADHYFCVVTAQNAIGESAPSNEIEFDAGRIPDAPTSFTAGTTP